MASFPIWQRYLFKEVWKIFVLFLSVFFFLYVAIDYSLHMQDFIKNSKLQITHFCLYYLHHFIKRTDLLLPLALVVATIKVLFKLNAQRELLALQVAGLKLSSLLKPFFIIASLCTLFNLVSAEILLPKSLEFIDSFQQAHLKHSDSGRRKEPIHAIHLQDHSKVIYQSYDSQKEALFDVLWIRSADDIWRIKYLKLDGNSVKGQYVDHLIRTKEGTFEKRESFDAYLFENLKWDSAMPKKGFIPIENRSSSELYQLLFKKTDTSSYQRAEILTNLTFKCVMPFLSFLVVIALAPFCVKATRHLPIFFVYALGLFGFIAFYTLMDAAVIIGSNHILPAFWVVFMPFILCLGGFGWNFAKIR